MKAGYISLRFVHHLLSDFRLLGAGSAVLDGLGGQRKAGHGGTHDLETRVLSKIWLIVSVDSVRSGITCI